MAVARANPRAIQNPAYRPAGTALRPRQNSKPTAGFSANADIAADFAPARALIQVNRLQPGFWCIVVEWTDRAELVAAKPQMIAGIDSFRNLIQLSLPAAWASKV